MQRLGFTLYRHPSGSRLSFTDRTSVSAISTSHIQKLPVSIIHGLTAHPLSGLRCLERSCRLLFDIVGKIMVIAFLLIETRNAPAIDCPFEFVEVPKAEENRLRLAIITRYNHGIVTDGSRF